MSKLNKMLGIARVATHTFNWKDFTLQPGFAYGLDADGIPFVSSGTKSSRFGISNNDTKDRHIIVYRCVNYEGSMPVKQLKTAWGTNSKAVGRRIIVRQAGKFSTPWAYVWQWDQVSYDSLLAREIFRAIKGYHGSQDKITIPWMKMFKDICF